MAFDALSCPVCSAPLGYLPAALELLELHAVPSAAEFTVTGRGELQWRCLNAAWGCNWLIPAEAGDVWCRSCRLTRGRPDMTVPDAVAAWSSVEFAKRRLVHQLDSLGLVIEERTASTPHGLVFDLVHLPGERQVTGFHDGVVTLDLTEADEEHRDDLRRAFAEPLRTVIGHLRHEVGHYYWGRLVADGDMSTVQMSRALFGDERVDYGRAIEAHHRSGGAAFDSSSFVTSYAASHPLEDWAETFGHYLHVVDALGTADAFGLAVPVGAPETPAPGFGRELGRWRDLAGAINAVSESIGSPPVYPFAPTGRVVEKLCFVHERVVAATSGPALAPSSCPG